MHIAAHSKAYLCIFMAWSANRLNHVRKDEYLNKIIIFILRVLVHIGNGTDDVCADEIRLIGKYALCIHNIHSSFDKTAMLCGCDLIIIPRNNTHL